MDILVEQPASSDASRKQSTRRSREESYFCKCIRTIATNECVVYVFGNNSVSPSECPKWKLDSFNSKPRMLNKYNVVKPKKAVEWGDAEEIALLNVS